jgi:WD40 repeat protein
MAPSRLITRLPLFAFLVFAALPLNLLAGEPRRDLYGDPLPDGAIMRFGTVQRRLLGPTQLAITPDGKTIVGLCGGRYVQYWDAETLKLNEQFELPGAGPDNEVFTKSGLSAISAKTAIAPNGRSAARCKFDSGSLEIWNLASRKALSQLSIPKVYDDVLGISFSPNSQTLVLLTGGNKAPVIRFVSIASGKQYDADAALVIDQNATNATFAFSPDSSSFIASFGSQPLVCWDAGTGKVKWHTRTDAKFVTYFPNGRHIVAVVTTKIGDEWAMLDASDGTPVHSLKLPKRIPDFGAIIAPDNRTMFLSWSDEIELWDMQGGRSRAGIPILVPLLLPHEPSWSIIFQDDRTVITAFGELQRWNLTTARPLNSDTSTNGHLGLVERLAFSPDGLRLASRASDGSTRTWDVQTGQARRKLELRNDKGDGTLALSFTDGGRRLVYARWDSLAVWDVETGQTILRRQMSEPLLQGAWLAEDGAKIIRVEGTLRQTGKWAVTFLDIRTGTERSGATLRLDGWFEKGVSPAGSWLVARDGRLLDMQTGERQISLMTGPNEEVAGIDAVSPDGRLIAGRLGEASGGEFDEPGKQSIWPPDHFRVWESASGREFLTFVGRDKGQRRGFRLAAFQPGLRALAIADGVGLRYVNLLSGRQLLQILAHQQYQLGLDWFYATSLAWSPDGKALATGHPDGTILLWDMSKIKREQPRKLTFTECDNCWTDLMAAEPANAYKAIFQLADSPETALPWLREKLKPATAVPQKEFEALIHDLGAADFKTREAAQQKLSKHADRVEAGLRAAPKTELSTEQLRRVQALLDALAPTKAPPPEILREIRAVAALEYMKTPEAKQFLQELARGLESARLTREAKEAVSRTK